jgi:hypothetical protein
MGFVVYEVALGQVFSSTSFSLANFHSSNCSIQIIIVIVFFFLVFIILGFSDTGSAWYVGHYLAYCTSPG